jgi:two-component system, response regulator PdtaR
MNNFKILVIEDDSLIAKDIKMLIEDWGYTCLGCATNAMSAFKILENAIPDVILVDIQLDGKEDGIQFVEKMQKTLQIPCIYLTAQADWGTVERSKSTFPAAYLLKPFDERHLHISLELALYKTPKQDNDEVLKPVFAHEVKLNSEMLLRKEEFIFIKQKYRFVKFRADEILFLEAEKNYTTINCLQHKFVVRFPLLTVLERLQICNLVRINRSCAINIAYVDEFDDSEVIVKGKSIGITTAFKDDFLKKFNVI